MSAHVSRPAIALPPHAVTTDQILADIRAHNPDHPRLPVWERVIANSGVETRYWSRPLDEAVADRSVGERAADAFGDALDLAEAAARRALGEAGLIPGSVDCIITSHVTSWTVPNLDVRLAGRLGLRPDVSRIPMATLACAGGVQALVRATDYVRARPGSTVLVVTAETLSTIYHRHEDSTESMIYKALFGDGAAATIVTDRRLRPGLAIHDTWEYLLPDSLDRYWGRIDDRGLHFDSTRKAARAANDVLPHLHAWLGDRPVDWAAIHPGAPSIITDVAASLGLDPVKGGRHAHESLQRNGNLGASAVLDVLRRIHDDPPLPGTPGMAVAFGPGFVAGGVRGAWE